MAQPQVSNISKGLQGFCSKDLSKTHKPSTIFSVWLGSELNKLGSFGKLKYQRNVFDSMNSVKVSSPFRVSAVAAATKEKTSFLPEILLQPINKISGVVKLPGSKSFSNRILVLATLSEGTTVVDNLLDSDDIHYMLRALETLGLGVKEDKENKRATVEGCSGKFPVGNVAKKDIELFLGNAGTAMRLLTAAVAVAGGNGCYILDGVPRMRETPIMDLVVGLKQLGADVDCTKGTDCPPICVNANGELPRGKVKLSGSISNQYLTALLMEPPMDLGYVEIGMIDILISVPYVEMNLKLMERFGVSVEHSDSWDRF